MRLNIFFLRPGMSGREIRISASRVYLSDIIKGRRCEYFCDSFALHRAFWPGGQLVRCAVHLITYLGDTDTLYTSPSEKFMMFIFILYIVYYTVLFGCVWKYIDITKMKYVYVYLDK